VQRIDSKDASGIEQSSRALFSELGDWVILRLHEGLLPLRVRDCCWNQCRHLGPAMRHGYQLNGKALAPHAMEDIPPQDTESIHQRMNLK